MPHDSGKTPPFGSASPLLTLPPELRNMIYEYALTFEGGLLADRLTGPKAIPRFHPAVKNRYYEANQMRYVCKQLYEETSHLILRFNDLTFVNNVQRTVDREFMYFTESCAPNYIQDIRRITLLDTFNILDNVKQRHVRMFRMVAIAEALMSRPSYPTVIIRMNWKENSYGSYVGSMNRLCWLLRHDAPLPETFPCVSLLDLSRRLSMNARSAANLRFTLTHDFEEQVARTELAQTHSGKELQKLLQIARDLHENGI